MKTICPDCRGLCGKANADVTVFTPCVTCGGSGEADCPAPPGFILVPEGSVEAMRIIIKEAAAVLQGHANRMRDMAAPDDWKSKTAAMLTEDHVKKLAWVHDLIKPK